MKLINFQGLNCYHNCIVSIANHLGMNYYDAFSTLWSETDFYFQPDRKTYLTRRMPEKLEALGVRLDIYLCDSPDESRERLRELYEGEYFIVGMDAFYIPWSQIYQTFHGPHFFIARNTGDALLCYDPTYAQADKSLPRKEAEEHAYDISRMLEVPKNPPRDNVSGEAREVMHTHPGALQRLLGELEACSRGDGEEALMLSKYADALINNRYLFRSYLERQEFPHDRGFLLFDDNLFLKWKAVKNGLIKAGIGKNRQSILADVGVCLNEVFDREMSIAELLLRHFDAGIIEC